MPSTKNIELELRSELSAERFEGLVADLQSQYGVKKHSKRLSVMFLGKIGEEKYDIRIRINNAGEAEIVSKRGAFHAHDRVETACPIGKDQILSLAKIFSQFDFSKKVTERETYNFSLPNQIDIALVRAKDICYLEIEKMSEPATVEKDKEELRSILQNLRLEILDKNSFNDLCGRLTTQADWTFNGTDEELKKLEEVLKEY